MRKHALIFICILMAGCSTAQTAPQSDADPIAQATEAREQSSDGLDPLNMARPFPGIITAGQPTRAEFDRLADAGVQSVINLRAADEPDTWDEQTRAEYLGLNYANIPVTGPEDLTRARVDAFDEMLNEAPRPLLVHCSSSNRVGALFALRAYWIEGKSADEALDIGRQAGLSELEDAVREKMAE